MAIVKARELEYLNNLVHAGRESSIVDFKSEWYRFEYAKYKFEFIKDCISFLNSGMDADKYIIIGFLEDKERGQLVPNPIGMRPDESNIQEIITEYIEPIPQIDILMRVDLGEYEADVVKIRKENRDQPYLFRKDLEGKQTPDPQNTKIFKKSCRGLGYIRHGSSTDLISRNELTNMFFRKQGNIYGYFDLNAEMNREYFSDIMVFLDGMNLLVRREALDSVSAVSPLFRYKLNLVFQQLIMEGRLFGGMGRTEALDPVSRMILESKDNVARLKRDMDRGENSLITLLFCACCNWFGISANPVVWYELSHDALVVGYDDPVHHHGDRSVEAKMTALNEMLAVMDAIPFYYDGTKLLKIREIKFDEASVSACVHANVKFKVSEDIIPLLIEPLYKRSNKMEIALRELLQNAIDACKFNGREEYAGKIEIAVRADQEKAILSFLDNGIGMNLEDIEDYYLTVGKSKKRNSDLPVVGQFGIGALTMFLIGRKACVRTKKSGEEEYFFELFKDSTRVSELTRRAVKGNESYTRIDIEIDHEPSKPFTNGLNDVVKHLGIDRWVVNSENLDVVLKVGEDDYPVPNLNGMKDCFVPIYEERNRFVVEIYEEDRETAIRNEPLARTVKMKNLFLYNDILITAAYRFSDYKNLKANNIPFVVIAGKPDNDEMSVELSRESAVVGNMISEAVARYIYKKEIKKITDYLEEHQDKETNAVTRRNALVNLTRASLKLPKLLLTKNRVEICGSRIAAEASRYGSIAIVRSHNLSETWLNFPNDTYYVFEEGDFGKSIIADLLTENETVLLSNRFLHQYVLQASGSSNGFRRDALKCVMRDMLPQMNWEIENLSELWSTIAARRDQIKTAIEEKSVFGVYCYGRLGKSEVERLFNDNVEHRDVIVIYKRLDDYYFRASFDKTFDTLLNAAML